MPPRRRSDASATIHARCWTGENTHDVSALLELAQDPAHTADMVATIAPSARERNADAGLVRLVLEHHSVSSGVVSRYATHSDAAIRLPVAQHPLVTDPALDILCVDPDQDVRDAARRARI